MVEKVRSGIQDLREEINVKRQLFPDAKMGRDIYRKARENYSPEELLELRKNFGLGEAGSSAFRFIATGTLCQVILDFKPNSEERAKCEKKGVGTIDYDVLAKLEQVVCCAEHKEKGFRDVQVSLMSRFPESAMNGMGYNGFGRD